MIDKENQFSSISNSSELSRNKIFFLFLLVSYSILFFDNSSSETKFLIIVFSIIAVIVFYFNDNIVKFIHSDSLNPIPKSFVSSHPILEEKSQRIKCTNCGTSFEKNDTFCSACGKKITN